MTGTGYVGIDKDYFVSVKEVLNITAETGALETQCRVRDLTPADVVKARHAEWQLIHRDRDFYKDVYQCSECRFLVTGAQEIAYVYCPNCGARMSKNGWR